MRPQTKVLLKNCKKPFFSTTKSVQNQALIFPMKKNETVIGLMFGED
jgi:hypothetical protein